MNPKLPALRAVVVASPIRALPVRQPAFVDWEKQRKSPDVDALILAWIASHVPGGVAQRGRLH